MKSKLIAIITLSCFASAGLAATDTKTEAQAWLDNFKKTDLNNSGGLSKAELDKTKPEQYAGIKKFFDKMDANKDGQVTVKEYATYTQKQRDAWLAAFHSTDLNDSGGLSKAELDKTKSGQFPALKRHFDLMDANKDGQISVAERDGFKPPKASDNADWQAAFKKADLNSSGGLSKVELGKTSAQSFADIKKDFDQMDGNKDGQVTVAEYQAHQDAADEAEEDKGVLPLLNELFK
jgi:Ca2+-binding EF-hand superfamily protein